MSLHALAKSTFNGLALLLAAPFGWACIAESSLTGKRGDSVFVLCGQLFALFPGVPGAFLRRGLYRWALDDCSPNCHIGFGTLFSHRSANVADDVYIGPYALIGSVRIGQGSLVGSRSSLLSGGQQHELQADGRWSATDHTKSPTIAIGENVWIGEGAILMADVGDGAMISAGAVVSAAVPAGVMMAGNPARFVKRLQSTPPAEPVHDGTAAQGESSHERGGRVVTERLPFIDWMKTLGMLVIIYGHAPAGGPVGFTEPFNPKQLGVAFFIFVLGFSLAREYRPQRGFSSTGCSTIYLWGIAAALVMSALVYRNQRRSGGKQLSSVLLWRECALQLVSRESDHLVHRFVPSSTPLLGASLASLADRPMGAWG